MTSQPTRSHDGRRLRVAAALAMCIGALWAAYLGWQESRTQSFEHHVLWIERENRVRLADVLLPFDGVAPSPELAGDSGLRLELRARWWLAWAQRQQLPAQRRKLTQLARDELRAAVARRPGSAFAWASLAVVKAELGSFDREFSHAFVRAYHSGRNETRVLRQLSGLLLRYSEQTESLRQREGRAVLLAIQQRDPRLLIEQASRYHALPWLCAEADLTTSIRTQCREQGYSLPSTAVP